ncbi:hypothetical protein EDB81DRAFT_869074 [Dactylonectria macrodidyma]|uniref:BZIP domain-containing protein n=1 Tax=Dactylonectria macrodidyma TaxID=307937 RepID=A0A9P9EVS0_9HYPO|nr:hypothetical protein EDB81DRAFT_869074 [Dactylonectria macrodidyma]
MDEKCPPDQHVGLVLQQMPHQSQMQTLEEDWAGVTSTAARRKLQNRLNQRARRRRKRQEGPSQALVEVPVTASRETLHVPSNSEAGKEVDGRVQRILRMSQEAQAEYMARHRHPERLLSIMQINIFHALHRNSEALGQSNLWLFCDSVSPFGDASLENALNPCNVISAAGMAAQYPRGLAPTTLQLSTPHHPWVDLFPWPKLRDRIIWLCYAAETMDDGDLCFDMAEFDASRDRDNVSLIVWGEPWDPRGWEATVPFLKKWGWLLEGCTELLEGTNHWRAQRGERKLRF